MPSTYQSKWRHKPLSFSVSGLLPIRLAFSITLTETWLIECYQISSSFRLLTQFASQSFTRVRQLYESIRALCKKPLVIYLVGTDDFAREANLVGSWICSNACVLILRWFQGPDQKSGWKYGTTEHASGHHWYHRLVDARNEARHKKYDCVTAFTT